MSRFVRDLLVAGALLALVAGPVSANHTHVMPVGKAAATRGSPPQ